LLLGILCFNWVGYRWLHDYLAVRANNQLEARLDQNQYDESQLITLRVPATHLAYYNSSSQFQRVDGQIEIEGVQYKYVKRRIYNDTLEVLCIPNHQAMRLQTAKDEFFKLVNDLQQQGQNKKSEHPGSSKNFSLDNYTVDEPFRVKDLPVTHSTLFSDYSFHIPSCYAPVAKQPPDHCLS
jgi:hypothetical protein